MTTQQPLMPDISVVIPCFNRAGLIPRAVRSVQAQKIDSMEIILVDDGSADDTVAVVARLQAEDPRIRLVRHERNRGEAGARNTGVKNARGAYIAFLDSDDEWLPGKLDAQLKALAQAGEFIGGCLTGAVQVSEDGQEFAMRDWSDRLPITEINILSRGCGLAMGTTFLVRRQVYDVVGYYDETLPLMVDLDWLCRFLQSYSVIKLKQPLARYNKSPMRRGEMLENAIRPFVTKNARYLEKFSLMERRKIHSQFLAYISQSYEVHGPQTRFVSTRGQCLLLNPFQSLKTYLHWMAAALYIIRVGEPQQ